MADLAERPRGSEEFVEQPVPRQLRGIRRRQVIGGEERRHQVSAEVVRDAVRRQRKVLAAIRDPGAAAVDEAAESRAVEDQIGQTGVAVSEYQIFPVRSFALKLRQQVDGVQAGALVVEIGFVHSAGRDSLAGQRNLPVRTLIERAPGDRHRVQEPRIGPAQRDRVGARGDDGSARPA